MLKQRRSQILRFRAQDFFRAKHFAGASFGRSQWKLRLYSVCGKGVCPLQRAFGRRPLEAWPKKAFQTKGIVGSCGESIGITQRSQETMLP
jgi:hypothetical protein